MLTIDLGRTPRGRFLRVALSSRCESARSHGGKYEHLPATLAQALRPRTIQACETRAMRAVVIDAPGAPDALRLCGLPALERSCGFAVVAIVATGVNPVDAGKRRDPSWAQVDPPM